MKRMQRGSMVAAAVAMLAVAGCRTEPTAIEPVAQPAFDGGVGTIGSGNKTDTTTTLANGTTQAEETGVGTLGSGN